MKNVRKLRVFLCHASQDKPIVRELNQRLLAEGWIDSWLDDENLLPGQNWNLEIEKAVESTDAVIACISTKSITKEGYIQKELKYILDIALEKPEGKIFIIPLRLDDCQPPRQLRNWQYADFFPQNNKEKGYQKLLSSIKTLAGDIGISFKGQELADKSSISASFREYLEKNIARDIGLNIPSADENLEILSWREMLQSSIVRFDEVDIPISKEKESVLYKQARELFENRNYLESIIYWNELCKRHPNNEEYETYIKTCIAKLKRNQSIFSGYATETALEGALLSAMSARDYKMAYSLSWYGCTTFNEPESSRFYDYFSEIRQMYSEQLRSELEFHKNNLEKIGDEKDSEAVIVGKEIVEKAIIVAKKILIIEPSEVIKVELAKLEQIREQIVSKM